MCGVRCAMIVLVGLVALAGCRSPAKKPPAIRTAPKSARELPTTDGDIFLGNLEGQTRELARLVAEHPEIPQNRQRLSSSRNLLGRIRGDVDELQRGIDDASTCIRLAPDAAECRLLRAEQEQSLHRFAAAADDVAEAKKLGAPPARVADVETELAWNAARYDEAIAAIRRAARERPGPATLLRLAQLEHDLGKDEASDAAFVAAEDRVTDTGPMPVSHLYLQRGIALTDRGRLEDAVVFFREAVRRMPAYVAASEHLAETLHLLGKDDEATAIYTRVVASSDDPEFAHALARLHAAHGRAAEAKALEDKAETRTRELLATYPEAMYWHAAERYLELGQADRARALLEKNAALRPNSTSFVALARAQLDAGDLADAKATIEKALAMPVVSAKLFAIASRVEERLGDAAKARAHRERALALSPRAFSE